MRKQTVGEQDGATKRAEPERVGGVTLVDELVEGVLPVGPGLPPHDRPRVVVDAAAVFGDVLPVGLHVALETRDTQTGSDWTRTSFLQPCVGRAAACAPTCWK